MKNNLDCTTVYAVVVVALLGGGCEWPASESVLITPSSVAAPVGTTWVAIEVDGVAASGTRPPDLAFESERRVGGSSGCNRYFAEINPSPPSVRMGSVGGTLMACEPPLMEQERRFINALQFTSTYRVDGNTMQFNDRTGRTVIRFRRSSPDASPLRIP